MTSTFEPNARCREENLGGEQSPWKDRMSLAGNGLATSRTRRRRKTSKSSRSPDGLARDLLETVDCGESWKATDNGMEGNGPGDRVRLLERENFEGSRHTAGNTAIVSGCASIRIAQPRTCGRKRCEPHDREQGATNLHLPCGESHRGGEKPRGWNVSITRRRVTPEGDSTESPGVDARSARWRGVRVFGGRPTSGHDEPMRGDSNLLWEVWANPGDEEARCAPRPGGRVHRKRCGRGKVPKGRSGDGQGQRGARKTNDSQRFSSKDSV